jgi:5'-phosphate synthase pdxT subunit
MTTIGVLALQGDFAEHAAALTAAGADGVVEVRLPKDLAGLHGLIIPGGESTTITRLLVAYGLLEPLTALVGRGFPVWGTCAGAIVLARQAIGLDQPNIGAMDITVRRNAFGSQIDSFEIDLPVAGLGEAPYHCIFIRAPVIESAGEAVDVLASLPDGRLVAARQGHMLATAFHPELTRDARFHRYFLQMAEDAPAAGSK